MMYHFRVTIEGRDIVFFLCCTKPTVNWNPVEGGNCLIDYFVKVWNATGQKVIKGPITDIFAIIEEFEKPSVVTVFARNSFTSQIEFPPENGTSSDPFPLYTTTTTKATTTGQ